MPETHLSGLARPPVAAGQDEDSPETFLEVLRYVKSEYVDRIEDDRKLGFGAVRTMLVSLDDPKTRFYDPAQRKQLLERLNGEFHGIGATIAVIKQTRNGIDQRRVAIVAPVPGGPADRAGLRSGDVITEVSGRWIIAYDTRQDLNHLRSTIQDEKELKRAYESATSRMISGLSLPKALEALTTTEGRKLDLTVERAGLAAPLKVSLETAATKLEPVEFKALNESVGYLRVTQFNDRAALQIAGALAQAKGRALVVDLRDNAGGPVASADSGAVGGALAVLRRLVPDGPVATIVRPGNRTETLQVTGGSGAPRRLAVLVNGGTSNLAEMVAAALHDRAGAKVIGEQTFGDATWQKLFDLHDGAAMTITAGRIVSGGLDFAGKGIQPDIPVATGGPRSGDAAADRAVELLEKAS